MKNKVAIATIILSSIIILGVTYSIRFNNGEKNSTSFIKNQEIDNNLENEKEEVIKEEAIKNEEDNPPNIFVHLCGAVKKEGVYEIPYGTRLIKLIDMANGLNKDAASNYINQAMVVEDGQQIYIPTKEEVINQDFTIMEKSQSSNDKGQLININTADLNTLMEIPGIGIAKAEKIIEYRESIGEFKDITELMKVSGIKQGLFDKMSPYIVAK